MGKILLRGVLAIAPLTITIVLLLWMYNQIEYIFGRPIEQLLGTKYYFPGLGVMIALLLIFFVGLILNNWLIQKFYHWFDREIKRIPLINMIYNSVNDLMGFFNKGDNKANGAVVKVDFGGTFLIGIVTRENFDNLPKHLAEEDEVAVFFPFSYQIGGFTAIVSRSKLLPIDMSFEQGIRFIVTAASPGGAKKSKKEST